MTSLFIENDGFCSSQANSRVACGVETQEASIFFTDDRSHTDILGANDQLYLSQLLAQLGGASDALDGTCADLAFGDWVA